MVFERAFLTAEEERGLLADIERLEFNEIVMHGVAARRTARHFGVKYDYAQRTNAPLASLRERCADLAEVAPDTLEEARADTHAGDDATS